jgi:mono/diheme cytochrome c family protein
MRRARGALLGIVIALVALGAAAPSRAGGTGMFNTTKLDTVSGAEIFQQICQGCHMPDARGATGAGKYPALTGNPALGSPQYMAVTIIQGRRNMPAFGAGYAVGFFFPPTTLTYEQIAAVINYVRTHFGNRYTNSITTAQIEALYPSR